MLQQRPLYYSWTECESITFLFSAQHIWFFTSVGGIKPGCYLWFLSLLRCPALAFTLGGHLVGSRRSFAACGGHVNMTLLLCHTIKQKLSVSSWCHRFFCPVYHQRVLCVSVYGARRGFTADWTASETASTRFIMEIYKPNLLLLYCIRLHETDEAAPQSVFSVCWIRAEAQMLGSSTSFSTSFLIFHMQISHILCGSISREQQTEWECFIC